MFRWSLVRYMIIPHLSRVAIGTPSPNVPLGCSLSDLVALACNSQSAKKYKKTMQKITLRASICPREETQWVGSAIGSQVALRQGHDGLLRLRVPVYT